MSIGGVDVTGQAVGQVSISRGRRTVYERPNAGYASIELRDVGDLGALRVGSEVQVSMANSSNGRVTVFTGALSDWEAQTVATGGEPVVFYRLQAVGPLALLNRRVVFADGRVQENDGQRVRAAVLGAGIRWEEVSTTLAWEDAEGSWESFGSLDVSLIDDGLYQVAALAAADGGYNALSVAQDAAFDADGFLYESADGRVGYQNGDRRRERQVSVFAPFPSDALDVAGLNVTQQLADVTNRVTVEFAAGAESATDSESVVQFGVYESSFRTNLVEAQDAATRAVEFILRHGQPHRIIERLPFNLLGMSDALRDEVLAVELNDAVAITDVPSRLGFTEFQGFVEGITLTLSDFQASLVWNVSDRALSVAIPSSGGLVRFFFDGPDLFALHEFRRDGQLRLFDSQTVDYLLVAGGGGGGGAASQQSGGGGGAGGVLVGSAVLSAGVYPVVVGAGGLGARLETVTTPDGPVTVLVSSNDGEDSTFNALTAVGGGRGGGAGFMGAADGNAGGSGGGGATGPSVGGLGGAGVSGQGNDGGAASGNGFDEGAGGGGGAGAVGGAGSTVPAGGDGGDGLLISITGEPVAYGAGGGGGPDGAGGSGGGGAAGVRVGLDGAAGEDAVGFGSGGGGGAGGLRGGATGGAGSGGVVMVRYKVR